MSESNATPSASDEKQTPEQDLDTALAAARVGIERGDYGKVVRLLEPLTERFNASTSPGAELRLLLATACMGQGQSEIAAQWCRSLRGTQDAELRARGKELLMVLEAPTLERPRDWSLTLPDVAMTGSLESMGAVARSRRQRRQAESPPPPPVGTTKAPLGFAALTLALLLALLLATSLGGCMEVRTDLHFSGTGRLQIKHQLRSSSGASTPWQNRLAAKLRGKGFRSTASGQDTVLSSAVLPMDQAREALKASVEAIGDLLGESLPAPVLDVEERNWLLGVRQSVRLDLDLRPLDAVGGVDAGLHLQGIHHPRVFRCEPLPLTPGGDGTLVWPLRLGEENRLAFRSWRWSPLGLGALVIALLLPLVIGLQRLRRQLGFGLPELPA